MSNSRGSRYLVVGVWKGGVVDLFGCLVILLLFLNLFLFSFVSFEGIVGDICLFRHLIC